MIFERPDLNLAAKFLTDFGLRKALQDSERPAHAGNRLRSLLHCRLARTESPFCRLRLTVDSLEDSNKLAGFPEASPVEDSRLARRRQARPYDGPFGLARRRPVADRRSRTLCPIAPPCR